MADLIGLGSIASGGLNFLSQLFANHQNVKAQKMANDTNIAISNAANATNLQMASANNELQMRLAKEANAFNLNMWNLQNAYNTPMAQMQRYREAGLNPNLIYGQGNNGNATSVPTYQMAQTTAPEMKHLARVNPTHVNPIDATQFMQAIMNLPAVKKMSAETENIASQTKLNEETAALTKAKFYGEQMRNAKTALGRKYWEREMVSALENTEADTAMKKASVDNFTSIINSRDNYENPRLLADKLLKEANAQLAAGQLSKIEIEKNLVRAMIDKTRQEILNLKADQAVKEKLLEVYDAEIAYKEMMTDVGSTQMTLNNALAGLHRASARWQNMKNNGNPLTIPANAFGIINTGINNLGSLLNNFISFPF